MVKVKICGITNLEDARAAISAGCHALGFVFYKKSPRYIEPRKAAGIIRSLPKRIFKVGVFVDTPEKEIKRIAKLCRLDILQFHGRQAPQFCAKFKGYKIIKAFRVRQRLQVKDIARYKVFAVLFDTYAKSKAGGTGKKFDWRLLSRIIDKVGCAVFLSGGLNKDNVVRAIKQVKPDWVDVSTSVESFPGKKDAGKIKAFVRKIRGKDVTR